MKSISSCLMLFFLLIFSASVHGAASNKTKAKSKKATAKCPTDHLEAKTCSLEAFGLRVQVTESKISIFDGTWRALEDFPYPGEAREWEEVGLKKIGKRNFLEIKLWDEPQGEVGIQSLLWFGYEIKDLKPVVKWKEVLQKRTVIKTPEAAKVFVRPKGQFEEEKKTRYLYDKPEKFAINVDKKGVLHWSVGHRKHNEKDEPNIELNPPPKEEEKKDEGGAAAGNAPKKTDVPAK